MTSKEVFSAFYGYIIIVFLILLFPSVSHAQLDLDQEVLIIPDTHNEKPYIWNAAVNPAEYELLLSSGSARSGVDSEFLFSIASKEGGEVHDMHAFVVDEELLLYAHVRPTKNDAGGYSFRFNPPEPGKYRLEVVFQTGSRWVNLRKDIKIKRGTWNPPAAPPGDEDYEIRVKLIPLRVNAEHVATFLYDIRHKGAPLSNLEKMDGYDMHVAAWDENLKEFIYAVPKQNLGGPEVAVSLVFLKTGKHMVFAEFMHRGVVRKVEYRLNVFEEQKKAPNLFPDYESW